MKKFTILILLFITTTLSSFSNVFLVSDSINTDTAPKKKTRYLTYQYDLGIKGLSTTFKDRYKGEYYSSDGKWVWKERDSSRNNILDDHSLRIINLNIMLSIYKNIDIGFCYNGTIFSSFDKFNFDNRHAFFAMAGIANYSYFFHKIPNLYINSSFTIGNYQSRKEYTGPGNEIFTSLKLGAGYRLFNRFSVKLWAGQDYMFYRESTYSKLFEKEQHVKIDWNITHFGMSMSYRFFLIPD